MTSFFSMLDEMFKQKLALRPNCLLTRKPLVFISGYASPFLYANPWGEAVHFLYEHGYKVEVLRLPFYETNSRKLFFKNWIQKQPHLDKHFFIDKLTYHELNGQFSNLKIGSLNIVCSESHLTDLAGSLKTPNTHILAVPVTPSNWRYKLHSKYLRSKGLVVNNPIEETFYKAPVAHLNLLLDHCIFLAELDFDSEI